jgi:DNA-binding HxlR family transcriptional regulator
VEYGLTAVGRTLLEPLAAMCTWNERHSEDVWAARGRYDRAE